MKPKHYLLCAFLATGLVSGTEASAQAKSDDYPLRPVRMIVPFPPGGVNDIVARLVGLRLNERWGQSLVIDNRGGAGGNIGTEIGARAAPVGYTLTISSTSTFATNVGLYPKLPFDPRRDFAAITLIATAPNVLAVNAAVAAKSVQELIQLARAHPKKLNYSSFGEGSSAHLVGEMFKSLAVIDIVHVPYKGGGPALVAAIAGEVQMTFSNLAVALPQVKAGKVRGIAVTSARRANARDPGIAPGYRIGERIDDDDGVAGPRPYDEHRTRRFGEVEVPRQRARIRNPGQIREVHPRSRNDRRQIMLIHETVKTIDIGQRRRLGGINHYSSPSCLRNSRSLISFTFVSCVISSGERPP